MWPIHDWSDLPAKQAKGTRVRLSCGVVRRDGAKFSKGAKGIVRSTWRGRFTVDFESGDVIHHLSRGYLEYDR